MKIETIKDSNYRRSARSHVSPSCNEPFHRSKLKTRTTTTTYVPKALIANRRWLSRLVAFALLAGVSHISLADTPWPDYIATLKPGVSRSPIPAPVPPPDLTITSPSPDIPADKSAWLGRWRGWSARGRANDQWIVVTNVTTTGATVFYSAAGDGVPPFTQNLEAVFVGDELQARVGRHGAKVFLRLRKTGEMEYLYNIYNEYYGGLLTKSDK